MQVKTEAKTNHVAADPIAEMKSGNQTGDKKNKTARPGDVRFGFPEPGEKRE